MNVKPKDIVYLLLQRHDCEATVINNKVHLQYYILRTEKEK